MDISPQERAIKGLIAFWEDIYFVQGKEYVASRLKPGIQNALKEVSPLFFSLAEGFAKYNDYPIQTRRDLLRKVRLIVSVPKLAKSILCIDVTIY